MSPGIGARSHLHTRFQGPMEAFDMVWFKIVAAHPHMRWTDLAVKDIDRECGDKENPLLCHHGNELRVFIQITAVLNGIHPGLNSGSQAGSPQRMAHHPFPERMRLIHQRPHLVQVERRILGSVPRP